MKTITLFMSIGNDLYCSRLEAYLRTRSDEFLLSAEENLNTDRFLWLLGEQEAQHRPEDLKQPGGLVLHFSPEYSENLPDLEKLAEKLQPIWLHVSAYHTGSFFAEKLLKLAEIQEKQAERQKEEQERLHAQQRIRAREEEREKIHEKARNRLLLDHDGTGMCSVAEEEMPEYGKSELSGFVCVYSPVGGCGKTTFSMALAQAYAQGKELHSGGSPNSGSSLHSADPAKVLYLSLQGADDWPLYYQNASGLNLSDVIYELLMGGDAPGLLREALQRQANGVSFLCPVLDPQDLRDLSVQERTQVLAFLNSSFDVVVCDLGSTPDAMGEQILKRCSRRFFLVSNTPGARMKWRSFMRQFQRRNPGTRLFQECAELIYLCDRDAELKEIRSDFPGESFALPWTDRLFKETDGRLIFRQDSTYYERIRQLASDRS